MNNQQILLLMLAGHLVSDYTLQGWLADGKQKSWWRKLTQDPKYDRDYVVALVCHALYWSIFTCAPFFNSQYIGLAVLLNAAFHAYVDDLKANRLSINLLQDQLLHLAQILVTFFTLI